MTIEILNFEDALAKSKPNKNRLILGNGFSIAFKEDIFQYKALLEEADFSNISECVRNAFDLFQTQNFELIIRKLSDTAKVMDLYNNGLESYSKKIKDDAAQLKEILIKVIAGKHPGRPSEINENQYDACIKFLFPFETIYTLNYDLLLYWTLIHDMEKNKILKTINDGFVTPKNGQQEYVCWDGSSANHQNVFYLHGGLHIFDAGTEFRKLTYKNTDIPLMDQIRKALDNNLFPHFVAEGTHEEKLERLNHSIFLNRGYKSLKSCGGSLFIYGHSLNENDKHIFNIIEGSSINKLFISLFGDVNSEENKRIIQKAEAIKRNREQLIAIKKSNSTKRKKKNSATEKSNNEQLELSYFQAESVKVWG